MSLIETIGKRDKYSHIHPLSTLQISSYILQMEFSDGVGTEAMLLVKYIEITFLACIIILFTSLAM